MMIVSGLGATAGVYREGTDFRCNTGSATNSCYAIDGLGSAASTTAFKNFQKLLNTFASRLGFKTLIVDGLIGTSSLNAVLAILNSGLGSGTPAAVAIQGSRNYRIVAAWIPVLTPLFNGTATATPPTAIAPTSPGTVQSSPPEAAADVVVPTPLSPHVIPDDTGMVSFPDTLPKDPIEDALPWWLWLLVGAGAVGVVVTGVYFIRKRKLQTADCVTAK